MAEIEEKWLLDSLMENGRLSHSILESEYQRGFIDCWNKVLQFEEDGIPFWK